MKHVQSEELARLNNFFDCVNVGNYVVKGDLQAFHCKLAGTEKKLSKDLDNEVQAAIQAMSPEASASPVGPLSDANSRKTLVYLILALNHMYPDYDFSALRAHHFTKEPSVDQCKSYVDSLLLEVSRVWDETMRSRNGNAGLLESLWAAVDSVICLSECDAYSYKAQHEGDPFTEHGNLWFFIVFFYNKKMKRMLCFSCHATGKRSPDGSMSDDGDDGFLMDDIDNIEPIDHMEL